MRDFPAVEACGKATKAILGVAEGMWSPHTTLSTPHFAVCVSLHKHICLSQSPCQESRETPSCNTEKYFHLAVRR